MLSRLCIMVERIVIPRLSRKCLSVSSFDVDFVVVFYGDLG